MSAEKATTTGSSVSSPEPLYSTQNLTSAPSGNIGNSTLPERSHTYTCGEILTTRYGRFTSPLYPSSYPRDSQCKWEIRSAPKTVIKLKFVRIDLESNENCKFDSVTIYDGPLGSSKLGTFCQSRNDTIHSSSNVMTVVFISDGSIQNTGFEAYYSVSAAPNLMSEKCGDTLTRFQDTFGSPILSNAEQCLWHIIVNNNYKIHLKFYHFHMIDSESCRTFSLSVYDGTPQGALLGNLCETTTRQFNSSSNSLSIVYTKLHNNTDSLGIVFSGYYTTVFQNNTNVTLSCHSDYMKAQLSLPYLESLGYSFNDVHLNDPICHPQIVADWLEFHIPYRKCLTLKEVLNDTINYENTLFTSSVEPVVMYRKKLSLTLRCRMHQNIIVDSLYSANDTMVLTLTQYGLYSANLTFFNDPSFIYPVYNYPYLVELNQNMFLQATLGTTDPNLVLFVDTCVASPDPFHVRETQKVYNLIQNGCPKVSDYQQYPSPSPSSVRFGFSAFSFMRIYSSVYIQCKLVVCRQSDRGSRCNQGCKPRTKRAVESHPNHVHAVAGPVKLRN
ncbi:deleted in malignant brain tumors 1 protein-like [Hyla sarda]|uniref:deleted in malignant brain tumors 1 protein-like n=1 Tax=Hyla sarda TaxID=327740 RepID=UPI0024C40922|nr:deleted in malignant brain tumors 1 protein-like [Hyla sarda]